LTFDFHNAYIGLYDPQVECHQAEFTLKIWDPEYNFPISSMVNVLSQLVDLLSNVGELSIAG
jgi:disulfide oxidoreductase YuzD